MQFETVKKVLEKVIQKAKEGQALGSFNADVLKVSHFNKYDKIADKIAFKINDGMTMYIVYYRTEHYEFDYYISFIKDNLEVDYFRPHFSNEEAALYILYQEIRQIREEQTENLLQDFLNS